MGPSTAAGGLQPSKSFNACISHHRVHKFLKYKYNHKHIHPNIESIMYNSITWNLFFKMIKLSIHIDKIMDKSQLKQL